MGSFFRSDNVLSFNLVTDYTNVPLIMINAVIHLWLTDFSVPKLHFIIKRLKHKNKKANIPQGSEDTSLVKGSLSHEFPGL